MAYPQDATGFDIRNLNVDKNGIPWDESNPLPTTATISGDVNVDSNSVDTSALIGKASNGDFVTAYDSATSISISGLPAYVSALNDYDIETIRQIDNTGTVVQTYTRDDASITIAGSIITVVDATFTANDKFVIYTNIPRIVVTSGGGGTSSGSTSSVLIGSDIGNYTFDASLKTVTLTGIKTLTIEEVLVITNITTQEIIYLPSDTGKGGTILNNVITLEYDTTLMSDTDSLQIYVQYNNSQDFNLGVEKTIVENPTPSYYQDVVPLISALQVLTTSFVDLGFEIPCAGYNKLALWLTVDINQGTEVEIRILHKHTSAGSEEYREIYLGASASNITTINLNDYQVASNADQLFKLVLDCGTSPYIQVQARMRTDGGTDAEIDACYYTLAYA